MDIDSTKIFMHEIKNSLNNIFLLVELIETSKNGTNEYLPIIKREINNIRDINNDYNNLINNANIPIRKEKIDISEIIIDVINELKYIDNSGIKIITDIPKSIAFLDKIKFKQVIYNIISNAYKYNVPKGIIFVQLLRMKTAFHIKVYDSGIGMSSTEIDKLGTPFYRCKNSTVHGTGLGWTIIKQLCEKMKWSVKLYSVNKDSYKTVVELVIPDN